MLKAGETTNVTFKVNVMGTSANPTVRLVLGTKPELGFDAQHVEGDTWKAEVTLPLEDMTTEAEMRVEVLVNGRMFTPMKKLVPIVRKQDSVVDPKPEPEIEQNWVPEPEQIQKMDDTLEKFGAKHTAEETEMIRRIVPPTIAVKQPPAKPKGTSGLSLLKTMAQEPAKKVYERVRTPLPKPGSVQAKPAKITIADVDSLAGKGKKIKEAAPIVRARSKTPVKLIKEQLFYE